MDIGNKTFPDMGSMEDAIIVELNIKHHEAHKSIYADMQKANNWKDSIRYFFNSPAVIFGYYVIFYAIFLLCISITHLVFFNACLEPLEIILAVWVVAFILEEIRQVWFIFPFTQTLSEGSTHFFGMGLLAQKCYKASAEKVRRSSISRANEA